MRFPTLESGGAHSMHADETTLCTSKRPDQAALAVMKYETYLDEHKFSLMQETSQAEI